MSEYVDRDTLLDNLQKFAPDEYSASVNNIIMGMPKADAVPVVHGHWIEKKSVVGRYFECSNCSAHENIHTAIKGYYCWRCGAKMNECNESEN